MPDSFIKDPDAVLDYKFDWSDWLSAGDTIFTAYITITGSGLTASSQSITDSGTSVTVWLTGGTSGAEYTVTCQIETNQFRIDDRTISINCFDI